MTVEARPVSGVELFKRGKGDAQILAALRVSSCKRTVGHQYNISRYNRGLPGIGELMPIIPGDL
jgi:hypothetical protein